MALTGRPAPSDPSGPDGPRRRAGVEGLVRAGGRGCGAEVWAVDVDAVQVTWGRLGRGRVVVSVEHAGHPGRALAEHRLRHPGGAGAATVHGLPPDTPLRVVLHHDGEAEGDDGSAGGAPVRVLAARTLPRPPGAELARLATVGDLHLGRGEPGGRHHSHHLPDRGDDSAHHPAECARAALAEAAAWGADQLVVKGDVCDETHDRSWDHAASVFGASPLPVTFLPGNHDTGRLRAFEPEAGAVARGLRLVRGVDHLDLPGLRVVLVDSCRPGNGWGTVARHAGDVADLVHPAPAALVTTHHHPQRFTVPHFWPHGIPAPDARRLARAVRAATPRALATSGHTHRCRTRRVAGLAWSEVAATNHFPGVWAGYRVFEGGLVQTVWRIADPPVIAWTEGTRDALRGVWALWATGRLADRCFALRWP